MSPASSRAGPACRRRAFGRLLKRVIQKSIQDPLAELILSGAIKDGEAVNVSVGPTGLTFNGKMQAAA